MKTYELLMRFNSSTKPLIESENYSVYRIYKVSGEREVPEN